MRSQPTGIAWPRRKWRGPRGPRACPASSCRARPCSTWCGCSRARTARSKSRSRRARSVSSCGDLVLTSKLIDGTFPDYDRVIPRNNDKVLDVDTAIFADAVDRVSTISREKGRAVKLNISAGKLMLTVNNPDSGSAEEEMPVKYAHDPIDIGFNSRYLLDVAGQVKSDHISFFSPMRVRRPSSGTPVTNRPSMF